MVVMDREDLRYRGAIFIGGCSDAGAWEFIKDELDPWRKIYLRLSKPFDMGAAGEWNLHWNGYRLAGSRDTKNLKSEFPEIYQWLFYLLDDLDSPFH